jgi:hypothetical protein
MAASLAKHVVWPRTLCQHIKVALIPSVSDQLRSLEKNTDLSVTDLTNRAISAYSFLDEQMRVGNDLMVRDHWTGEMRLVRFA